MVIKMIIYRHSYYREGNVLCEIPSKEWGPSLNKPSAVITVLGSTSSPRRQTHTHLCVCGKLFHRWLCENTAGVSGGATVLSVVTRFHPYSQLTHRSSLLCVSGCSHGDCVFNISGVGQVVPGYGGGYPQQYYPGNSMASPALQFFFCFFFLLVWDRTTWKAS